MKVLRKVVHFFTSRLWCAPKLSQNPTPPPNRPDIRNNLDDNGPSYHGGKSHIGEMGHARYRYYGSGRIDPPGYQK